MAIQPKKRLFNYLGFVAWGDIGPLTYYKRPDKRVVVFAKTWPCIGPSPAQVTQRTAFLAAATSWRANTAVQRANWNNAARRASLCMTGYNMWLFWKLTGDTHAIATIQRQTGIQLLP